MRRILIADAAYDPSWTRVRSSISPQGLMSSGALPTAPAGVAVPVASPLLSQGAGGSMAGAFTRKTWTTPISLVATTAALVTPAVNQVNICTAQAGRKMLTIQNNSSATPTDTAPTLWISFGIPAVPGLCLGIAPGAGVAYEVNPPEEEVFYTWGSYVNGGGTAIIVGAIVQSILTQTAAQPATTATVQ
jgi:hypothetical protein